HVSAARSGGNDVLDFLAIKKTINRAAVRLEHFPSLCALLVSKI
uniref:Uncharacterized protein n=1 Tax=Anopheles albimanus TaxID=7167 RepID=A0A182FXV9_ANOAL